MVDAVEPSFKELMDRLEEVVSTMEAGDLPLEEALALFEEGVDLSRRAASRLDAAERRIEELLSDGSVAPLEERGGS